MSLLCSKGSSWLTLRRIFFSSRWANSAGNPAAGRIFPKTALSVTAFGTRSTCTSFFSDESIVEEPDDIVRATDYGVYVAKLGGGSVNTASGDFVFGMTEAYLIENGEITAPLREGNLIGNGPQVLLDIDLLGNDFAMGNPGTCGKDGQGVPVGDGQPTLRVKSMTIGGTAA